MSFYRSTEMGYYSLVVPRESAWLVVNELAELDCIHFDDYDPARPLINRPFANYIKRCEDSLAKLDNIERQMVLFKKNVKRCDNLKELLFYFKNKLINRDKASHTYYEEIEHEIDSKNEALQAQLKTLDDLKSRQINLVEHMAVLSKGNELLGQQFFQPQKNDVSESSINIQNYGPEELKTLSTYIKFCWMVGVIDKSDEYRFKKIVFRVTKGNAWVNLVDIDLSQLNVRAGVKKAEPQLKCVYVIVYPGGQESSVIEQKLSKVVDAFNANRYDFPPDLAGFQIKINDIEAKLEENGSVKQKIIIKNQQLLDLTRSQIDHYLDYFKNFSDQCNCSLIHEYRLYVIKEKYLYTNLNLMKMQGSIFQGNFWMPRNKLGILESVFQSKIGESLPKGQVNIQNIPPEKIPPTHFNLNSFTRPFQEIVNTYGIPRYQEANPGLFTVATFPFLFAVMFGDIGHGFMLLLLGLYLVLEKKYIETSKSSFKPLIYARYLFLMMGFFAFYVGFIYNDFMSISFNFFGSCYDLEEENWIRTENCSYPFGIDPVWSVSNNELSFMNSFKMKLAVIIAVIHMLFGIFLKGANALHFNNSIDFFFEFIPQLTFLICTFGYMDFMIIFKWLNVYDSAEAPSIITTLINMALTPLELPEPPLWGDGVEQRKYSIILLTTAIICVPIMLFPKPYILDSLYNNKKHASQIKSPVQEEPQQSQNSSYIPLQAEEEHKSQIEFDQEIEKVIDDDKKPEQVKHSKQSEHEFSELFVHQVIETIEFVLGSISNTASYLRLWALSLAHGQLAEVFFSMTLAGNIEKGGIFGTAGVILGFSQFAMATFGVLMMMDLMECFLHALRLHWVEFQNKFFKADGYLFQPVSYMFILGEFNEEKQNL